VTRIALLLTLLLALPWATVGQTQESVPSADSRASAQPEGTDSNTLAVYADFGWSGVLPASRWSPLTIWINEPDRLITGFVTVEHEQDATQRARIVAPFTTAPGMPTPVRLAVHLPAGTTDMRVTVTDEQGAGLTSVWYSIWPSDTQAPMPKPVGAETPVIASVGTTGLSRRGAAQDIPPGVSAEWSVAQLPYIEPEALPRAWRAYEGLTALAVRAAETPACDPRAIEAVKLWVESGGRLVIVAPGPGTYWRRWLPDGPAGDLLELDVPRDLEARVGSPAFEQHAGRRALLTEWALREGWTLDWPTTETIDGDVPGLLAQGPVGLGWVVVVGVDPRTILPPGVRARDTRAWRDIFDVAAAESLQTARDSISMTRWMTTGVPAPRERLATERVLNWLLASVEPVGLNAFAMIGVAVIGLALVLGPVDWIMLGRLRRRHWSWLTALAWIGASTALAYYGPRLVRSSSTIVQRIDIVDTFHSSRHDTAWGVGATGVYAGYSGRMNLFDVNERSWWRGESVGGMLWEEGRGGLSGGVATLETIQVPGALDQGSPLQSIALGSWTLRWCLDEGPVQPALSARVTKGPDGTFRIVLDGVPADAEIENARFRVARGWAPPAFEQGTDPGARVCRVTTSDLRATSSAVWRRQEFDHNTWWRRQHHQNTRFTPGVALSIPGPAQRELAIERRVQTGRYACLTLELHGMPPEVGTDWAEVGQVTVARLLVPIEKSGGGDS